MDLFDDSGVSIINLSQQLEGISSDELYARMGEKYLLIESPENLDLEITSEWAKILYENFQIKTVIYGDDAGGRLSASGLLIYLGNLSKLHSYGHEFAHALLMGHLNFANKSLSEVAANPLLEEYIAEVYISAQNPER